MALIKALRYQTAEDKACLEFLKSRSVNDARDVHELMGVEGAASKSFFTCYFRNIGWRALCGGVLGFVTLVAFAMI